MDIGDLVPIIAVVVVVAAVVATATTSSPGSSSITSTTQSRSPIHQIGMRTVGTMAVSARRPITGIMV